MSVDLGNLLATFKRNIERFGVKDVVRTLVLKTEDAARCFADESLALILVDASHDYASVRVDLLDWYPKLKPGGHLFCDDYHPRWSGVIRAIQAVGLPGTLAAPALWHHLKPACGRSWLAENKM
jgi:hypothetical protein